MAFIIITFCGNFHKFVLIIYLTQILATFTAVPRFSLKQGIAITLAAY